MMDIVFSTLSCPHPITPEDSARPEANMSQQTEIINCDRNTDPILSPSLKARKEALFGSSTLPSITVSPRRRVDSNLFAASPMEWPRAQPRRLQVSDLTEWMTASCIQRDMLEEYTRPFPQPFPEPVAVEARYPGVGPRQLPCNRGPVDCSHQKALTPGDNMPRSQLSAARGSSTMQLKRKISSWTPYFKSELGVAEDAAR